MVLGISEIKRENRNLVLLGCE